MRPQNVEVDTFLNIYKKGIGAAWFVYFTFNTAVHWTCRAIFVPQWGGRNAQLPKVHVKNIDLCLQTLFSFAFRNCYTCLLNKCISGKNKIERQLDQFEYNSKQWSEMAQ